MTMRGGLCLDDSQTLRRSLHDALGRSARGIDLDLSELEFGDCSALNVLLTVRRQALAEGKTITVTAASPEAERLLTLTDTYALFSSSAEDTSASVAMPVPPRRDNEELQSEVVQLRRALRTRPEIDLARGILMASFGLSADEAWEVLVMASQNTNTKLHRLARDVVTTVKGTPLSGGVQNKVTAAVAKVSGLDG
ncbi:ANTAR domain-containing protein [Streptomyces olivochromogenes]|nr:ANTAR domain-containing protein [Streptomyces olivochromogenes]